MAIKTVKLTKVELDEKLQRIIFLKQDIKKQQAETKKSCDEHDKLRNELEGQYSKGTQVVEIIKGNKYLMKKILINTGANAYDLEKITPFLKAIKGAFNKVVEKIVTYKIDAKKLDALVKDGKLPQSVLDEARKNNYTFKSDFKTIEEDAKATATADAKNKKNAKVAG